MSDDMVGAQGGTAVVDAGSQALGAEGGATTGAEDAGAASEPTVDIDGAQVPLSVAKRALKNDERFTQTSQEQSRREQAVQARERRAEEALLATSSLSRVAEALSDPDTLERIVQVAPEVGQLLPQRNEQVDGRLLAENLGLKFDLFTRDNPEYSEEQLQGIRSEAYNLAQKGRLEDALDFANIGLRLYKDDIIAREAKKLDESRKKEEAQRRAAGTVGQGTAPIPPANNLQGLRGEALISAAHAANEKARKK